MQLSGFDTHSPISLLGTCYQLERSGYYRLWTTEHHEIDRSASPLVAAAAAAARTSTLKIGTAGVLLRLHPIVSIVEQAELLWTLFPGRFELGVAGGIAPIETGDKAQHQLHPSGDDFSTKVGLLLEFIKERQATRHNLYGHTTLWLCAMRRSAATFASRIAAGLIFHDGLARTRDIQHADRISVTRAYLDNWSSAGHPRVTVACFGACARTYQEAKRSWNAGYPAHAIEPAFMGTGKDCIEQLNILAEAYGAFEMAVDCFGPTPDDRLDSFKLLGAASTRHCD